VYPLDLASLRGAFAARTRTPTRPVVAGTVWLLGIVSALTDVSSEMVASILPAYLFVHLQLSPIQFGLIDGLYQGVTAVARLVSGIAADRTRRYKLVAAGGYALSAVCKLGLLAAGASWGALAAVISVDRVGKGIRTAPRDALISLASERTHFAAAFGVHRALDTVGVVIGPLLAFALLRSVPGRFDVVFIVSFAVAIVGLAVLGLLVQDPPAADSSLPTVEETNVRIRGLFIERRFRLMAAAATLAGFVVISDAFLYLLLQWRAGLRVESLPLLYMATASVYLVLAAPFGRWADRIGRPAMYVIGHMFMLVIYVALAGFTLSPWAVGMCLLLHGAYYAATDGVLAALVSAVTRPARRASSLSALATATSLARLGSSLVVGVLWAWGGPGVVALAGIPGLVLSIVVIAIVLKPASNDVVHAGRT
jgi:MFS family permease